MKKHLQGLPGLVCCLAFVAPGCSKETPICVQEKAAVTMPATIESRVGNTNEFAFDLYRHISSSEDNLIISPHSLVTAFGMAYAGARGTTEREIATVLRFNYPPAGFHEALEQVNRILTSRGQSVGPEEFQLSIVNSIWGREDMTYLKSYLDVLSLNYGADMRYRDFANRAEEVRNEINYWVARQTWGLVPGLIPSRKINASTYLVLVNIIYFKASWLLQFDPAYTHPRVFTRLDGSTVVVPAMAGETRFLIGYGEGYSILELPYKGEECSMIVLLPDEGQFKHFENILTPDLLEEMIKTIRDRYVLLYFPKFQFETAYDLNSTLAAMGMPGAFAAGANFSGMDGTDDGAPWISFVAHKAFIAVDEFGTSAAAGTGIGVTVGIPPEFHVLRPFIFAIRDKATGAILFLGRVLDPSK